MKKEAHLYMIMLGCKPKGRFTEQHDIFFGIANSLVDLVEEMKHFWPEAKGKIHIDAWKKITHINGFDIEVLPKEEKITPHLEKLFFINLGGYKENEFEEFHYKVLTIAKSKATAIKNAKQSSFFKHFGFKGATSHIDDKYGVDVDDLYDIQEILATQYKQKFQLYIKPSTSKLEDKLHIGYLKIDKITSSM